MRILLLLVLIPFFGLGQSMNRSETNSYIWRIDSLRQNFKLESFAYPDRSIHGGDLRGYYLNDELVYLTAKNSVSFYSDSYEAYFKDSEIIEFSFQKHFPLEEQFWEKYAGLGESADLSLMEYEDTELIWKQVRGDSSAVLVHYDDGFGAEGIHHGYRLDERPTEHLDDIQAMTDELNDRRIRAIQFHSLQNEDFTFADKWDYPLGVYTNQYGQVSCDGFCPEGAWDLKVNGRIPDDSLELFYSLVDTTHQYHSLKGEAIQYEFFESDYIDFTETEDGILGQSRCDAGNHSSLHIKINGSTFTAWVEFVSLRDLIPQRFELISGTLVLDYNMLEAGVAQGKFDLTFENSLDPELALTWKGAFFNYIQQGNL